MISKEKLKLLLPYAGLPVLMTAYIIVHTGRLDAFIMLLYILVILFGYIASVIDIKTKKIPNSLILAMFGAWVLAMVPKLFVDTEAALSLLFESVLGFAVSGALFLLVYLISKKGLGGGDVKLIAVLGLYIGLAGVLPAMLFGSIIAALTALVLLLMKRINKKDSIPLAPFLYVGTLITLFF